MLLANNVLLMVPPPRCCWARCTRWCWTRWAWARSRSAPPYFVAVFVPLMVPALFLMGVGPIARWKKASVPELAVQLRWAAAASFTAALVAPLVLGQLDADGRLFAAARRSGSSPPPGSRCGSACRASRWRCGARACARRPAAGTACCWRTRVWACSSSAWRWWGATRPSRTCAWKSAARPPPAGTSSSSWACRTCAARTTPRCVPPSRSRTDGRKVDTLYPEKRVYTVSRMPMTEVSIDRGFTRDLYVSMGEPLDGGTGLERAPVRQALRQLDLGRLPADGASAACWPCPTGATGCTAGRPARRPRPCPKVP